LDPKIGQIDERTDIYSLGVVFYEMLTSQLPFSENNAPINLAYMHLSVVPEPPTKLRKELLPKAEQVVMKMLEKDPLKRYQSFEEVIAAVTEIEEIAKYYREGSSDSDMSGSFFEIVTEDQSFSKSVEEFNRTFHKKPAETKSLHDTSLEGRIIQNRYRIEKLLLKRILSNLYLGYDMQQKISITIQIPNETRPTFKARLEREIEIMRQVEHPSFVRFLDIINEEDTFYVIREYIEGRSIKSIMESGKVPIDKAVRVVISILDGLIFLHGKGIVHRDINSDVIMITADNKAKITTLGITRVEDASSVSSGEFLGIVQYTAPEQITQSKSDARSDIYSVGILLFELLTGKTPFTSPLPVDVMDMHLKKIPRFPDQMQNQIPLNLQRVVLKTLSKSPDQRYQSVQDFQNELKHFLDNFLNPNPEGDATYMEGGSIESGNLEDPSSVMHKNIMETTKNPSKNLNFSIKKSPAPASAKKKTKVDIDQMITANIVPKEDHKKDTYNFSSSQTKSSKKVSVLLPLLLIALAGVLGVLFFPTLQSSWKTMTKAPAVEVVAQPPIVLVENQKTVFSGFEPWEISFKLNKNARHIVIEQLPPEVKVLSTVLQDNSFKAVLYSELLTLKTPFVARLVGLDEDKKELFAQNFILTVENNSMLMVRFAVGSRSYEKTTAQGVINGEFDILPFIHHFNIYLPLRYIVETFNGVIEYDFPQNMITIKNLGDAVYRFYLYQNKHYVDDQVYLTNPILEIEDRAYLPIFLFSEKKGLHTSIAPGENGETIITVIRLQ
jgi:serine/threonine protein kinase